MVKKGKAHEEVQADGGSLAGQPTLAEGLGAAEAAAVVDGDNPSGASEKVTGLEDGTAGADIGDHGAAMGGDAHADGGNGAADAEGEAGRPETVAPETAQAAVLEGMSDGDAGEKGPDGFGSRGTDALVDTLPVSDNNEPSGTGGTDGDLRDGDAVSEGGTLRQGGGDGANLDEGAASEASGFRINGFGDEPLTFPPYDGETDCREVMLYAGFMAEYFAARLEYEFGNEMPRESLFSARSVDVLHDLVMRINERASPEVMANQLVITGVRETADLTTAQRIGLQVFGTVARLLDDRKRQLHSAVAAMLMQRDPIKPLPVDETTLESVDGPMETWGGA